MNEAIQKYAEAVMLALIDTANEHGFDKNEFVEKVGLVVFTSGRVGDFTNYKGGRKDGQ